MALYCPYQVGGGMLCRLIVWLFRYTLGALMWAINAACLGLPRP